MRLLIRMATVFAMAIPAAGCGSLGPFEELYTGSVDVAPAPPANGQVYLFRGFIGGVFSRGMDTLAEKVRQNGVNATVASFTDWQGLADDWIERYRNDPARPPLVLVGHSMGGTVSVQFAQRLKAAGLPVNLVVAFDPARVPVRVPANVERFVNLYQSNSVMGAGDIEPEKDFHGAFASVNLRDRGEIIHVNIDKSETLHDAVLAKILQVAAMPPSPQAAPVAIRYSPPAGSRIELWDGGAPVVAEPGETIESLAVKYAVPAWAVADINRREARDLLRPGQSVILPRYLASGPPRTATSYLPERP